MQDGLSAINDLVTQAAKGNAGGDNQENDNKDKGEGGNGGAGDLTDEQKAKANADAKKIADDAAAAAEKEKTEKGAVKGQEPDLLQKLLEEHKFGTVEELRAHLAKKDEKQKSPEEEKREKEVYEANLVSYAVENNLMSLEDVTKYNAIKAKSDEDLVFESFVTEFEDEVKEKIAAERKEAGDETKISDAEVLERLSEEFEKEYPTESENEKAKQRALNKLAKAAKEIRGPVESSYTTARKRFDDELGVKQSYPAYKKAMDAVVESVVPKSYSFFKDKDGDDEIDVEVEISDEDRNEILKSVSKKVENPSTYSLHKDGKAEDIKKLVEREANLLLWEKYNEAGKKKIAEKFVEIGKRKGSDIGAKQSFEMNQAKAGGGEKGTAPDAAQQVLDSTRKK